MSTHTPGPWCILPDVGTTITPQGLASSPYLIPVGASVYGPIIASVHGNETQERANASLIAAAPDLLSCLVDMVNFYRREMVGFVAMDQVERAARAIHKAGGTTL